MARIAAGIRRRSHAAIWWLGERLAPWVREVTCAVFGWSLGWFHIARVPVWEANVEALTGVRPNRAQRQEFLANWLRNNLISMSLARWGDREISRRVTISDHDVTRIRDSLSGPGLVLVLPHMGSWDLAGAWCATQQIPVTSVAERIPDGVYELFTKARAAIGIDILAVDDPGVMQGLLTAVRHRRAVCLLGDRDLNLKGVKVSFGPISTTVPVGPALVAKRSGADLRIAGLHFQGSRVHLAVSDVVPRGTVLEMCQAAASAFAANAAAHPTSWLNLGPIAR